MDYITDKKAFATSLFEEAFGVSVDHVLSNWKDYTSMVPAGSTTNMLAAYKYAQDFKFESAHLKIGSKNLSIGDIR